MPRNFNGVPAAVAAAILMATIGVISRKAAVDAESVTFFRLFFGALFMGLFLVMTAQGARLRAWPSWPVLANGGMLAAFVVFYIQAINFTTMANAILLVYLAPVVAAVFAHFFLGEPLSRMSLLCTMFALLGFAMVMEFRIDLTSDDQHLKGLGFAFLAMVAYAIFILINRRTRPDIHPYTSTFYQLLVGAVVMLPFLIVKSPIFNQEQWLWLAGAGFFPGFLAILSSVVALRALRTSMFGTLAYLEPLAVVLFGGIFFGEFLSPLQWGGCAMIFMSGIAAASLTSHFTKRGL